MTIGSILASLFLAIGFLVLFTILIFIAAWIMVTIESYTSMRFIEVAAVVAMVAAFTAWIHLVVFGA